MCVTNSRPGAGCRRCSSIGIRGNGRAEVDELTGDRKAGDGEGGALIIGSRGMISHGTYPSGQVALHPQSLAAEAHKFPASLPVLRGSHEAIWVAACKGNGPVSSGFLKPPP